MLIVIFKGLMTNKIVPCVKYCFKIMKCITNTQTKISIRIPASTSRCPVPFPLIFITEECAFESNKWQVY